MQYLIFIFSILCMNSTNEIVSVEQIRDSYKVCDQSSEHAERFYELTEKALKNDGAIYKGYHGAALALKAANSWNPFNKMSYFNKGKKMIDKSIDLEPKNIELRMIRLSIQSNAPKIIGYYKNIEEDKKFILDNVASISSMYLKEYIEGFIAHSDVFSKS